jgi:hypothetical protein
VYHSSSRLRIRAVLTDCFNMKLSDMKLPNDFPYVDIFEPNLRLRGTANPYMAWNHHS